MKCFFCGATKGIRRTRPPAGTPDRNNYPACAECRKIMQDWQRGNISKEEGFERFRVRVNGEGLLEKVDASDEDRSE